MTQSVSSFDETQIENIFLNPNWELKKLFPRVYNLCVNGKTAELIVKLYREEKHALNELITLQTLTNVRGVPKIVASSRENYSYIILTKAPGIDLYEYTQKYGVFTPEKLRPLIRSLLKILGCIHEKGIVHKDIKPENIIYDGKDVALIDFEGKHTDEFCSPEQVRKEKIDSKVDLWALGVTCYCLVDGDVPYHNKEEILHKKLQMNQNWDRYFKNFLTILLERRTNFRFTANQALQHCWLVGR
jgi:calcium/calmodulin-dependent protein kinase I